MRFTFNYYCHWGNLVVRDAGDRSGNFSHSKEGVTQGDPLAMIAYGIGVPPPSLGSFEEPTPASTAYHGCMTRGWAPQSSLMRGGDPMP